MLDLVLNTHVALDLLIKYHLSESLSFVLDKLGVKDPGDPADKYF